MTEKKPSPVVPKLRFDEFVDDPAWEHTPLCELAERITHRNTRGASLRALTNSAERGVIDQREYFDQDIATNTSGYYVLERGDYVYNPRVSSSAPVGPISKNQIGTGVVSPLYTVFRFRDTANDFFAHYFKSSHWHGYLRRLSNSGARHDRMAITSDDLMRMPIPTPSRGEQQKIADCLGSLDDVIAAESRKFEALQMHKQGLMQQLFPLSDDTCPRLRFPEFRGAADWKPKFAGSLFTQRTEKGEPGLPIYSVTIDAGMIERSTFERDFYDIEDAAGNKRVYKNDIAYNTMRMWQGACGVAPVDCMVSPAYVVLTPNASAHPSFFEYLFRTAPILQLLTSHSRGLTKDRLRLYYEDFATIPLVVPDPAEQVRIAECLSSHDAVIYAQKSRVSALRDHKHGLLQQLLPTLEVESQ